MNSPDDARQAVRATIAVQTKKYLEEQRQRPGTYGTSPDGAVTVSVDGLGDVSTVHIRRNDLPEHLTRELAAGVLAAWRAARGDLARKDMPNNAFGDRPEMVTLFDEEINQRYGPPTAPMEQPLPSPQPSPSPQRWARPGTGRPADEDDFGSRSYTRPVT
jgi:hypothetical protein